MDSKENAFDFLDMSTSKKAAPKKDDAQHHHDMKMKLAIIVLDGLHQRHSKALKAKQDENVQEAPEKRSQSRRGALNG